MKKIIIAGGSGCLGKALAHHFSTRADEIVILSRKSSMADRNIRTVVWDGKNIGAWAQELSGADALINLTGKNVNCRYTRRNRNEILNSRIKSVMALEEAIRLVEKPPPVWIQAASATIYRHAEDRGMDEESGEIGEGFSVDVCREWEKTFLESKVTNVRKVLFRIGIVLDKYGGALPNLVRLVRSGLGGRQGSGNQYISWIHVDDVTCLIHHAIETKTFHGTFNCTSPFPVKNHEFMRTLRSIMKVPIGLPSPSLLLELGAWLIRTETELILKSRWVIPSRLQADGYTFYFPELQEALSDLLEKKRMHDNT